MMPLGLLSTGEVGEIVAIRGTQGASACGADSGKCDSRIEDLGLRVGRTVEMLQNAGSPVLLKVGESRVAVDRSIAMKIMIKEVGQ
jgi:ferrous iron transport protein A